jgi:Right handed beta helix region
MVRSMPSVGLAALIFTTAVAAAGTGAVVGAGDESASDARARACDRVAWPSGPGTVQRFVRTLRPGETGCLHRGTYTGRVKISRKGAPGRPITLQSFPGESARIVGRVWLTRRSAHVLVRRLYLDGRNRGGLPSPTINGRNIRFENNDVTNHRTGICFILGHDAYGTARQVTIRRNRIHDCGRLPATNLHQGIYVSVARDTRVVGNWITENADQGIQLFPDARHTYVAGNVIDSNGEGIIFGGGERKAASDSLVEGNVISNSKLRENVESHFEGPIGSDNVVRANCVGGGIRDVGTGGIIDPPVGFEPVENVVAIPAFRGPGDYRLRPDTPCAFVFTGDPDVVPGPSHRPPPLPRRLRP